MARAKNVTRTIKITQVTALMLNIETAEPFNATFNLEGTYKNDEAILKALKKEYEHEIIFVNDGSKDRTLEILEEIAKKDGQAKIISFSRNFGYQCAVTARTTICNRGCDCHY